MRHSSILADLLQSTLGLHRARAICLSRILFALFQVQTVNLAHLATALGGTATVASSYRRLQRFFQQVRFSPARLASFVAALLPPPPYILALDRTEWMLGQTPINFLVLSVVHHGIAFPLWGRVLGKRGNSHTHERMELMEQFLQVFGPGQVETLLADREFLGKDWLGWLLAHQIPFDIRIRKNMKVTRTTGVLSPACNFFRTLPLATPCPLDGRRLVCGYWLWVTGMRLPQGGDLIVVSSRGGEGALARYQKRWKIEVLFEALKSRGFHFEATRLRDGERLETLFGVVTIAYCWACHVGRWQHDRQAIPLKPHGRPAKSVFRYGCDHLRQALLHAADEGRREGKQWLHRMGKAVLLSPMRLAPFHPI